MTKTLDRNTPVLVGIGVADQRFDDPAQAQEAWRLMAAAVRRAAADAGSEALLSEARHISVPRGVWGYSDPARLIAADIGAERATTALAEIGILQQSLFADACRRIQAGDIDVAIVAGGEAKYRALRAAITGAEAPETAQEAAPDITLKPEDEIWSSVESAAGLGMPVGFYAIMESSLRHALGESIDAHRDRLAQLYASFSEIARDNPHAWQREGMSAEAIRNPSPKNRMLAFPYTKYHNTQWNVDQAGALIFCSAGKAQALGIARDKWVFPLASTESNFMVNVSQRERLHESAGARLAGRRALELAGVGVDGLDLLEMYSCFPVAVEIYARELGIALDRPLTVTGGMTFAGGPLNNYVLQSTCRMAELLREKPGSRGLVTSVSGMITKQGFGVWSTEPHPEGFQFADVTDEARRESPPLPLVEPGEGRGSIAGYTVLFDGDTPSRAIAVCDVAGGARTVVYSEDPELMQRMMEREFCGEAVTIDAQGRFRVEK